MVNQDCAQNPTVTETNACNQNTPPPQNNICKPDNPRTKNNDCQQNIASALPSWLYWVLLTAGVLAGALVSNWLFGQAPPAEKQPASRPEVSRLDEVIRKHEEKAQKRCQEALDRQMKAIPRFFQKAKQGCPNFADYALGWGSTRRWLQDLIPFGDCNKQRRFLEEKFAECIFAEEDVTRLVEGVVKAYLQEVEQIENKMLLELRADVEDLYPHLAKLEVKELQDEYNKHLAKVCNEAKVKLYHHDAQGIAALAAGEALAHAVAGQILTRLGVQLGTKIVSGAFTFGIGLVLSFVVDKILDFCLDPKGNLVEKLRKELDEMQKDISQRVQQELEKFTEERHAVRKAALQSLLTPAPNRKQQ
jgi:hypothetical protein